MTNIGKDIDDLTTELTPERTITTVNGHQYPERMLTDDELLERRRLHRELRDRGHSLRVIASMTGWSKSLIHVDIRNAVM